MLLTQASSCFPQREKKNTGMNQLRIFLYEAQGSSFGLRSAGRLPGGDRGSSEAKGKAQCCA